ncbi:MAG: hypothetical protein AAF789_01200 [Bacteroidota bacterium]
MERISPIHAQIIEEMITESLSKAAASMEQMLKIRMEPELISFGLGALNRIREFDDLGRFKVNLMKVAFKGQINGAFYFIINTPEMELINNIVIPNSIQSGKRSENREMKHDFMSEIENLIASQSTAALSEFLGVDALIQVPKIQHIKGELINEYLQNENEVNETNFYVKSKLKGVVVNIAPYFVWMIDEHFMRYTRFNIVT